MTLYALKDPKGRLIREDSSFVFTNRARAAEWLASFHCDQCCGMIAAAREARRLGWRIVKVRVVEVKS